jgi:hypothetical protein
MPRNKKPRRKYNPARIQRISNKPRLDSVYHLFQPIYTAFERIEADEIECVNGKAVFMASDGSWCELAPAMISWADCWERTGRNEGIPFDGEPLRRLANKIGYDIPLTDEDIKIGRKKIEETRRMFMSLPVEVTKRHAKTEQIQIEVDRLNLRKAA